MLIPLPPFGPHPNDSRAKQVELTGQGRRLLTTAFKVVEDVDVEFFSCFGDEGSRVVAFLRELRQLMEHGSSQ